MEQLDQSTRQFVLDIIDNAKDLTLATVRPDGYPQATTVSYANDGLSIYIGVGKESQKVHNIRLNNKVSLTINADYQDWSHIKGLSMGALAEIVSDPNEIRHAIELMIKRFPEIGTAVEPDPWSEVVFLKIAPQVISVLDYQKGFGHTELFEISQMRKP